MERGEGKGRQVDCDAQLEQGRRLAKAGPEGSGRKGEGWRVVKRKGKKEGQEKEGREGKGEEREGG